MKTTSALLIALGATAALTACSTKDSDENPVGAWTSAAPENVTTTVSGAASAMRVTDIEFAEPAQGETSGALSVAAKYTVTPTAEGDSVAQPYVVDATISGTWTPKESDDNEYILAFDTNSLSVAGIDAPELGPVTDAFLSSLSQVTSIEDVKVSKDRATLSFEAGKPEVKYQFVKK